MELKQIIVACLLLVFAVQVFDRNMITLNFYTNQKYIAANLCENRDKPQMNCNGKCQLCKKLASEDKKDKNNPEKNNETNTPVFSARTFFPTINISFKTLCKTEFFITNSGSPIYLHFSIFHPPQYFLI